MRVQAPAISLVAVFALSAMYATPGLAMQSVAGPVPQSSVPGAKSVITPRLLIKYRQGSAELRDAGVVNRSLAAAASRSGIDKAVAASGGAPGRAAITATLLRRSALPQWSVIKPSALMTAQQLAAFTKEVRANPAVEAVEVERIFTADRVAGLAAEMVPNDPQYLRYQWNFSDPKVGVHAPQAWAYSQGEGVVVAVVDSGIVINHPDLQGNVLPGYDMISSRYVSRRATDERVPGGWDMGDREEKDYCLDGVSEGRAIVKPSSWHGTHVAGTIAQETNNGLGGAGLAYKAKVLPVRVLGSCGGNTMDIWEGVLWAVGKEVPGLPSNPNPADIINMSLGASGTCGGFVQEVIDVVAGMGVTIVVSAGNDDIPANQQMPASCSNVITVAATDESGGKATYSNHGARVDVSAPGGGGRLQQPADGRPTGIWQMVNGGLGAVEPGNWKMIGYNGTSMASPHVAAAAAMIQSVVEAPLTVAQMRELLHHTASPLSVPVVGGRLMGGGIVNIEAALIRAMNPACHPNCGLVATPLANKVVAVTSGRVGEEQLYRFDAEAGKVITFMTYGGTGNVSLYASFNREPKVDAADARSIAPGSVETVRFVAPKAGAYFIKLHGVSAFSGVSLVARQ